MAKVNPKEVKEKLEQWAVLQDRLLKLEGTRNKKLDPHIRQFEESTKPIREEFDKKAGPIREKAAALQAEIEIMLRGERDAQGNPKPATIASVNAVASIERRDGSRIINAKKFFDFVKNKNEKFWQCFTVLIKEAKNVVSEKEIDDLSTKKTTYDFSIRINR
ncbi:MAG: hypothetical protein JSS81_05920 [Acidobacteria bacterium]|nr:hypothetical protein [Acidobacteriota bacterium]